MKYHIIEPEVIVGLGEKTEFLEKEPPFNTVVKLHIQLEDWLGDDLMVNSNCYIVTESLREAVEASDFTGFNIMDLEQTKDEYFDDNYHQEKPLPKFYWMEVIGKENVDDLFIKSLELNVSERFLKFLKDNFQVKYLTVDPIHDEEMDDFILGLIARDKKSIEEQGNTTLPIFKTHEGKEYTKEEWDKYQEEQRKNRPPGTTWSLLDDED